MDTLLYVALWGGIIFVMMRFGCGRHMMGHGHGQEHNQAQGGNAGTAGAEPRRIALTKDVDPVCGNTASIDKSKPSFFDGYVYYFCSRECREAFEAAPETYVGGIQTPGTGKVEHSHV